MRLIDADALIKNTILNPRHVPYITQSDVDNEQTIEQDWNEIIVICDNCGHAVQAKREDCKVSTIDPVVHGEWVLTDYEDENTYRCSVCDEMWMFLCGTPLDNGAKYCPNCGAKMDGGK